MESFKIIKTLLTLLSFFLLMCTQAQWTDNGSNTTTMDNVGIGTNSPSHSLDVYGTAAANRIGDSGNFLLFRNNIGGTNEIRSYGLGLEIETRDAQDILFNSSNGNRRLITIKGDGSGVGIGTTNVKSQLVVTDNFGANISGSTGGNAVFGSNLAVVQGGTDHNKMVTPAGHSNNYGFSGIRASWGQLYFYTKYGNTVEGELVNEEPRMYIDYHGKIGVGTTSPDSKLTVKGKIHAEEVKVDLSVSGPDYVFKKGYDLKSLEEVQNYIREHGHLPNIPSANEMEENGIQLGEMNMKLLEKIEELTLYTLQQQKQLNDYEDQLNTLSKKLEILENETNNPKP